MSVKGHRSGQGEPCGSTHITVRAGPYTVIREVALTLPLRPALARLGGASGRSLDAGEEAIAAERPADAFGGAQAVEQVRLRFAGKQIGELGEELR